VTDYQKKSKYTLIYKLVAQRSTKKLANKKLQNAKHRITRNRQMQRHTDRQTDRQTDMLKRNCTYGKYIHKNNKQTYM